MGHDTLLYAREAEVVASVNDASLKENTTFLKVSNVTEVRQEGMERSADGGHSGRDDSPQLCPCMFAKLLRSSVCARLYMPTLDGTSSACNGPVHED